MITVLDLQLGNTGSIVNMLHHLGVEACLDIDPDRIIASDGLILAGVGAFDTAMAQLRQIGIERLLNHEVNEKHKPILGICLGMQMLTGGSEEGACAGLNFIPGEARRFKSLPAAHSTLRVPHMGWNEIQPIQDHPLLSGLDESSRFYFVHSYYVTCTDTAHVLATTDYGGPFHSIIARDNVLGTQFHPEKSHRFGMRLLQNFAALVKS